MTNKEMNEAVGIANAFEDEIARLNFGLTYEQIAMLALISVKNTLKEIPMYTGVLNPKWATYDFVVSLLQGRINKQI